MFTTILIIILIILIIGTVASIPLVRWKAPKDKKNTISIALGAVLLLLVLILASVVIYSRYRKGKTMPHVIFG